MRNLCRSLLSLVAIALAPAAAAVELDGHILTVEEVGPASMIHSSVYVPLVCQDGIDNDGDGLVDAGEDPGCVDANDLSEHDPVTPPGAAVFQPLGLGGLEWTSPTDVSDDGSVVVGRGAPGGEYWPAIALRWEGGVLEQLTEPDTRIYADTVAISGDGRVGVWSLADFFVLPRPWMPFRWEDGVSAPLPSLALPGLATEASRDGSVIVGRVGGEAARWDGGELTSLALDGLSSSAWAVSDDGRVIVGGRQISASVSRHTPVRWIGANPQPHTLFPDPSTARGVAIDVSADGSVVVGSIAVSGSWLSHAFRWRDGSAEVLGEGFPWSVSADGSLVVGEGPSIWDASDHQRNLNDLLINDYGVDLGGWTLRPINAISGDGRTLVGWGINPDGDTEAWLVRLPPPCSDGLDNDGDGLVDFGQDPGCRSTEWSEDPECDDGVDNDGDGATDASDTRCFGSSDPNEACGLGFELVLALPPLLWLRRRRRRRR